MQTCFFTLTPSQSKRLIGKAVAEMACVQQALRHGRLIIAGGTTNAYVLEELTGTTIDKGRYTAGIITDGVACTTDPATRLASAVFVQGERVDQPWTEVIKDFGPDDVFIKGANAFDLLGNAGILLGSSSGGTIGQAMGYLAGSGAHLVMPVGMEKLVPDVVTASSLLGHGRIDQRVGMACGMFVVSTGEIITEIEALNGLFGVEAAVVAAGGVDGSEGAVTIAAQGAADAIKVVMEYVQKLKQEPPLKARKRECTDCTAPCER